MTQLSRWSRRGAIGAAALLAAGLAATSCSSGGAVAGAPRAEPYTLEGHKFVVAFPSRPSVEPNPPAFSPANGLPAGTAATGLGVGQLGSTSQPHSFEVIVAVLPTSSSTNLVAAWFRALAEGLKPERIDGHLGVRHISAVQQGSARYFGGFELVESGRTFYALGAYDSSRAAVSGFLESFSIRS
ncbi:MAG TPA: hypothetical protein VK217_12710 [Acidimicrobiales bacterium]|nr:hypothetical protein [Acidimicrobiales bacterium]